MNDSATDRAIDSALVERLLERVKSTAMTCNMREMISRFLEEGVVADAKKTRKVRSNIKSKTTTTTTRKNNNHHHHKTRKNIKQKQAGPRKNVTRKIKYINTL